jgi:SWI/SNF-related matrix-associated actin-dependent regulator 1 of chromatin subfamily A
LFAFVNPQRNQSDDDDDDRSKYEKDRIAHAKRIMTPFFLRRLKSEVLTDLPEKIEELKRVPMAQQQEQLYSRFIEDYKKRAKEVSTTK